ncbi:MAG TPA: arginine deiminase-related protein [Acidimicrobiales bacterium]|nr:arginine deiminase-related protein [Acidimicrobiales bacterium]
MEGPGGPLGWGRRFLMCPPEHFGVLYEINTWMHTEVAVDPDLARAQWDGLVAVLREAGATVEVLEPVEGLPDLVFTANAGIVNGRQFVPARFRHVERQGETPHDVAWFEAHGWTVDELPLGVSHEGAGDALPFNSVLVSGYRMRTDAASHAYLSAITRTAVRSVELVDPRLYHLDLTFCPLDGRRAIVAPLGWDHYGRRVMEALVPEPLVLDEEATFEFCANSVVVGRTVVMPSCPVDVGRRLETWGFDVAVVDVSEFQKAGGACRCLTLALDVTLSA